MDTIHQSWSRCGPVHHRLCSGPTRWLINQLAVNMLVPLSSWACVMDLLRDEVSPSYVNVLILGLALGDFRLVR